MSTPFIGEIRITPYNFAPQGWLYCDGSMQNISDYTTLFQLIGTTYGGDGQNTFGLPDLRSRVPLHVGTIGGNTYALGNTGGAENVTITSEQLPVHSHPFVAAAAGANQPGPNGGYPSNSSPACYTADTSKVTAMNYNGIQAAGGGQPHSNIMPFLGIAFIICTDGIYPPPPQS